MRLSSHEPFNQTRGHRYRFQWQVGRLRSVRCCTRRVGDDARRPVLRDLGHRGSPRESRCLPATGQQDLLPRPWGHPVRVASVPPESAAEPDAPAPTEEELSEWATEAEAKLPGLVGVFEPDAPGMHQTKTVDYSIVVEGELYLELDDGAEVHLPTGATIVQNGARHAWRNRSDQPATLAYIILDVDK